MIALYLIAAHLIGDFVFQTRWQAVGKFGWTLDAMRFRSAHVASYLVAFSPIIYWRLVAGDGFWRVAGFAWTLAATHWLTDSRRFPSTLGDVIAWRLAPDLDPDHPLPLPPNPWTPLPILIDQTLHFAQFAVLGGLWLS